MSDTEAPVAAEETPAQFLVADKLIPEESDIAVRLNAVYRKIMSATMRLYNEVGIRWAKQHDVHPVALRGVFMSVYQQMFCAVTAMHFGFSAEEQLKLENDILELVTKARNPSPLILPSNDIITTEG